jgi:hypothetical protein
MHGLHLLGLEIRLPRSSCFVSFILFSLSFIIAKAENEGVSPFISLPRSATKNLRLKLFWGVRFRFQLKHPPTLASGKSRCNAPLVGGGKSFAARLAAAQAVARVCNSTGS